MRSRTLRFHDWNRLLRAGGAGLALLAALVTLPGVSDGRFVCVRGMVAAGPACSKCHTRPATRSGAQPASGPCCTYVAASPIPAVTTSGVVVSRALPNSFHELIAIVPGTGLNASFQHHASAPLVHGPPDPGVAVLHLTPILRL